MCCIKGASGHFDSLQNILDISFTYSEASKRGYLIVNVTGRTTDIVVMLEIVSTAEKTILLISDGITFRTSGDQKVLVSLRCCHRSLP